MLLPDDLNELNELNETKKHLSLGKVLVVGAFCGLGMAAIGDETDYLTVSY